MVSRMDPFADLLPMRTLMNDLLNRAVVRPAGAWDAAGAGTIFPYDLYESGDDLYLRAVIPGADPKSIELTVNQGTLMVKGYCSFYSGEQERQYTWHVRQLREGEFEFVVTLPVAVNADRAEATYEGGVVTIRLPKAEEARVKRISITSGRTSEALTSGRQ